jgi:glycosyltransferase involved in cell wall biosynthesis
MERLFSRLFSQLADGIIVHSEHAVRAARETFRLPGSKRVEVIPQAGYVGSYPNSASRSECRAKLRLSPDALVFLFLGRIEAYKGLPELVHAFKQFTGEATLLIAGRASDRTLLDCLERQIDKAPNIKLEEGFVADRDVQLYCNAADIYVLPARQILNSSSIALAMSFGLPCIAPRFPGIVEMLGEDAGVLYEPSDRNGLVAAIARAIACRKDLARMGENGSRRVRGYTWDDVAMRTAGLYHDLVGRQGAAARSNTRPSVTGNGV